MPENQPSVSNPLMLPIFQQAGHLFFYFFFFTACFIIAVCSVYLQFVILSHEFYFKGMKHYSDILGNSFKQHNLEAPEG